MVLSALLIYRYLGQLGRDQIRAMQQEGALSVTGLDRPHRGALPSARPSFGRATSAAAARRFIS